MPNKNLDGIKKLSGEELERARKIVLDSIGERDKREKKEKNKSDFSLSSRRKMLDGISSGRVRPAQQKFISPKKQVIQKEERGRKSLDIGSPKKRIVDKPTDFLPSLAKQASFKKPPAKGVVEIEKVAAEEVQAEAEKKVRGVEAKEEERRKKELEKQREKEAEARKRAEAEKEKLKLKKEREKIRQERKEQRELARKIWRAETKRKLSGLADGFGKSFRLAGKIMAFSALFLIVSAVLFYLVFAFLLLKFNLDNEISRRIAGYVPVPAIITRIGFVEYYDYSETMDSLEKQYRGQEELREAARKKFIEEIVLVNLARKYNISLAGRGKTEIKKEINMNLAADKEINRVSYSRINKIRQLIIKSINNAQANGWPGESFEEIGGKYGDEQGYVNEDNEYLQLKEEVRQLAAGQVSNIIITERGYYIIKKEDGGLKYIFVKSMNFDEYLNDMISKLKVWILAN